MVLNLFAIRYTFKVYERLKKEQHIDTLFRTGKAFSVFPVRIVYLLRDCPEGLSTPVQAGFSVPKKKFRHSVDRHRVRRLMVEAWRMNKHLLHAAMPIGKQMHVFLIFTNATLPDQETVTKAVTNCIAKLAQIASPPETRPDA